MRRGSAERGRGKGGGGRGESGGEARDGNQGLCRTFWICYFHSLCVDGSYVYDGGVPLMIQ